MNDIWQKLEQYHKTAQDRTILSLFDDPNRFDDFSAAADGMLLDISKTNIDHEALALLVDLAVEAGVAQTRDAMFHGDRINSSENRAVLHTALRADNTAPLMVDGEDVRSGIAETLHRMETFAGSVQTGDITGAHGESFTDVVRPHAKTAADRTL